MGLDMYLTERIYITDNFINDGDDIKIQINDININNINN